MRLVFTEVTISDEGILISKANIIDETTGEVFRIAKLTPELALFLKSVEINIDDYMTFQEMKKKNPALTKLVSTFNLYT